MHRILYAQDPRTRPGELLWPAREGPAEIARAKRAMGSYAYAGQYQQRPAPQEGGILKRHWWRFWRPPGRELPPVRVRLADGGTAEIEAVELPRLEEVVQSWDMAFKDGANADYVVGQVWGAAGADRYLIDQVRARLGFTDTLAAVKELSKKHPGARTKLVEEAANGAAVIASLRHQLSGLVAVSPKGSKESRAHAVSPQIEGGNVYLPHPQLAPWVEDLIEEASAFPNGAYDDQVDVLTQALLRLENSALRALERALIVSIGQTNPWSSGLGSGWTEGDCRPSPYGVHGFTAARRCKWCGEPKRL